MSEYLDNEVILITGGTGSFGQKFAEITLREYNPEAVRIFSRGELLQQEMLQRFNKDERLRFFIGDVRDQGRLYRAMEGVDTVIHTAALKQITACEYNPIEAVRTNIEGAVNVINAAVDNGVKKVLAISTDKAAYPTNLYGATKLVMERLFVHSNVYTGKQKTKFSCVRYGNVIGSRGSIIPLLIEQQESGSITITDERMTRFWITKEWGVRFAIECIGRMHGGEIFIPKIPSMKVTDIADIIAPKAKRKVTGIRPGEKISEILLTQEESRHTREFDEYFVIEPADSFWNQSNREAGKPLPEGFRYTSENNDYWLSKEDFKKILEEI